MKESMGQIIKRLRKENCLTQEELAEQLGVTYQAVSKWENDNGLPDISQIVPLATFFNVSTDILFGMCVTSNEDEVKRIIDESYSKITSPATKQSVEDCYNSLMNGLKRYPSNTALLANCLEMGISLAYPENDIYDAINGETIYKECVRQADIIIKYSKQTWDILRAHMIMVLLHSAYGNFEKAEYHAEQFPIRTDMTYYSMKSYIAHFKKQLYDENENTQNDMLLHFETLLDDMVHIAICYFHESQYELSEIILKDCLKMIESICKYEDIIPNFHHRERGDIYSLLAEVQLKQDKTEEAIRSIKMMINYDITVLPQLESKSKYKNPALQYSDYIHKKTNGYIERLKLKLNTPSFNNLRADHRINEIINKIP